MAKALSRNRFKSRKTKEKKPLTRELQKTQVVSDKLVDNVFANPNHPLTPKLTKRFGVDQGTGVKILSGTKADFRKMLNTLEREGELSS